MSLQETMVNDEFDEAEDDNGSIRTIENNNYYDPIVNEEDSQNEADNSIDTNIEHTTEEGDDSIIIDNPGNNDDGTLIPEEKQKSQNQFQQTMAQVT